MLSRWPRSPGGAPISSIQLWMAVRPSLMPAMMFSPMVPAYGGVQNDLMRVKGSVPSHELCWKHGVSRMSSECERAAWASESCHWSGVVGGYSDQSLVAEVAGSTRARLQA